MLKILKILFITGYRGKKSSISNEILLKELISCFKFNLKKESVGKRMLYPTSFMILLHPDDYKDREGYLPFVVQEIVNNFYEIIKERKAKYPNYIPPSVNWHFQFSPCEKFALNENIEVDRGNPHIIAQLYNASGSPGSNTHSTENTRVSFKPVNSTTYSIANINRDAFLGIEILASGVFNLKFNPELLPLSTRVEHSGSHIYAELTFSNKGKHIHFDMIDREIHISGSRDKRNESWVLRLDDDTIINSHLLIKYAPEQKTDPKQSGFFIAAYGTVKCNSKKLEKSVGGNLFWEPLSRKSNILLNDLFIIDFEAKK